MKTKKFLLLLVMQMLVVLHHFLPEFMISTDGLMPSVYFMRIYRNDEFLGTQKLIVE